MAALVINDRVKETSTTTGTGTISLAGASQGFESFVTGIGTTNKTYYCITNSTQTEFETGIGTVTDATPDQDIEMERISYADWLSYPNKYSTGTPLKFAVDRNAEFNSSGVDNHKVYLWPGPSEDNRYEIIMWAIKYGEDIGDNYSQNAAVPKRMLPALISGLTVELANKHPKLVDINRRQELIQMYKEEWELAREEDRERASFYVTPKVRGYA